MMVSNRNLLFQGSIFRFHVCFGGCTLYYTSKKQSRGGFFGTDIAYQSNTFSLPSNVSARDNFRCLCNFNLRRRWGAAMRDWGGTNFYKAMFNLLSQWLTFKLFGITYLVGKIKFKRLFHEFCPRKTCSETSRHRWVSMDLNAGETRVVHGI